MIFDSIIAIGCILAFYRGWKKGIVSAILSLIAVFIAILLSVKLSSTLAFYLSEKHLISSQYILPVSFILIFIATIYLFKLGINIIEKVLKFAMLGWLNRLAGAVLYMFINLFIFSAIFWLFNTVHIFTESSKQDSKAYSFVAPIAPNVLELTSPYIPYCKNLMEKITAFAEQFSGAH